MPLCTQVYKWISMICYWKLPKILKFPANESCTGCDSTGPIQLMTTHCYCIISSLDSQIRFGFGLLTVLAFYKKWKTFKHTFSSLLSNCSRNFSTNFGQCVPTTATTCTCFSVDRKLVTLKLCFKELIEKHLAPKNKYKQTMVSVLLSMICCPMCGNIDTMCGNNNTVITSNSLLIWSKMAHTS